MSDLFRVTVVLSQPGTQLVFAFRDGKRALEAADHLTTHEPLRSVHIADEFGANCTIRRDAIIAVHLSEIGRQLEGEAEVAYAHAIKQKELQKKAEADVRLNSGLVVPSAHAFSGSGRKQ